MVGEGRTHVLKGMAVITTGEVVGFQEGILDMSGPGAEFTPFSSTMNLVIQCEVDESCDQYDHEGVLRLVGAGSGVAGLVSWRLMLSQTRSTLTKRNRC